MDYGDFDVIITFFTLKGGKLSLIAKSAKKSTKRFAGILELFSVLEVAAGTGRRKGLSVLQEAVLKQPFSTIRADFRKTAYASYWAELIYNWIEEDFKQVVLYYLLEHVLAELDSGRTAAPVLNILFQMRFLALSGHRPNLVPTAACAGGNWRISNRTKLSLTPKGAGFYAITAGPAPPSARCLAKGRLSSFYGLKAVIWRKRHGLNFHRPR